MAMELTTFGVEFKARLGGAGLLGDVRLRRVGFVEEIPPGLFLVDRNESFALGRKGVARGDCAWKVGVGEFDEEL